MTVVAVIPARYASSRFPGKALVALDGIPMVVRTARRVAGAQRIDRVLVATDDARIAAVVEEAGFRVVRTGGAPRSGTERVLAAVGKLSVRPSLVVNVQGDEPLVDPRDLDALVFAARAAPGSVLTLGRPFPPGSALSDPNRVKVVATPDGFAATFTRGRPSGECPLLHVGVYAYRPEVLSALCRLEPSPGEQVERLEQLRALENGIPIRLTMCVSERPTVGVDVPEDVPRVLAALRREGDRGS